MIISEILLLSWALVYQNKKYFHFFLNNIYLKLLWKFYYIFNMFHDSFFVLWEVSKLMSITTRKRISFTNLENWQKWVYMIYVWHIIWWSLMLILFLQIHLHIIMCLDYWSWCLFWYWSCLKLGQCLYCILIKWPKV